MYECSLLVLQARADVVASLKRQRSRSVNSLAHRSLSDSNLVALESASALLEDELLVQGKCED